MENNELEFTPFTNEPLEDSPLNEILDEELEKEPVVEKKRLSSTEKEIIEGANKELKSEDKKETEVKSDIKETPKDEGDLTESIIDELTNLKDEIVDAGKKDLDDLREVVKELIDKGKLIPFEGDKDIMDYSKEELKELLEANIEEIKNSTSQTVLERFIDSLPEELQALIEYHIEGGKDIYEILKVIGKDAEVFQLDPTDEKDAERIVAYYLRNKLGLDDDEIEEEIELYKKAGKLTSKAEKFYDETKKMQKEELDKKIKEQEEKKRLIEEKLESFQKGIRKVVSSGKLSNLEVDKQKLKELEQGITQSTFDSITGKKTNLLGHLIEKYAFVEPNHELLLEALWLLKEPEEYKKHLIALGEKKATTETIRKLKTSSERSTTGQDDIDATTSKKLIRRQPLQRENPRDWFFKR
jgi:hypothetical protein